MGILYALYGWLSFLMTHHPIEYLLGVLGSFLIICVVIVLACVKLDETTKTDKPIVCLLFLLVCGGYPGMLLLLGPLVK